MASIAEGIIRDFDHGITGFYDKKDLERGGIRTENRLGVLERFSVMTITIVGVNTLHRKFKSPLEIAEVLTELKRYARQSAISKFVFDPRKG